MIEVVEKFINMFTHSHPLYAIIDELDNNEKLCQVKCRQSSEQWVRFDYVFTNPTSLSFIIYRSSGRTELNYAVVSELVIIQFQNIFLDCRVIMDDGVEQFWVLNDVYKLDFKINK